MSVNLTAEQARALCAFAVPGRRLYVSQEDTARIHGGPVDVAIGAPMPNAEDGLDFRRLAEATIDEAGAPQWKAPVA